MPGSPNRPAGHPQVLPYLYYPDATAALAQLVDTFGFRELYALRDDAGTVWSAQVSTGEGVVLIGPGMDEFGTTAIADPSRATSRVFVYVEDVDEHHRRSTERGADIVTELADHSPNRIYIARDCGGHQWIFGTPLA